MSDNFDFVIIGAGIMGLTVAFELVHQYPDAKIVLIEKENQIGIHASGRNSGVLHSGIYYKQGSKKAQFCKDGAARIAEYCEEYGLPIEKTGKIILAAREEEVPTLEILCQQAITNGTKVSRLGPDELKKLEPMVNSSFSGLFCPDTAVIDPQAILSHLYHFLASKNVQFYFNSRCTAVHSKERKIGIGARKISYAKLVNTAGLYADVIAKVSGLNQQFTMIPFKGIYHELAKDSPIQLKHLIYPVPDLKFPFLGVHFTKSIKGNIYVGPTAIPVLGREHYQGFEGMRFKEAIQIVKSLIPNYLNNKQGFRTYANQEIPKFLKYKLAQSARSLVPNLNKIDLVKSHKVGIRAQLFDVQQNELVMDFVVKKTENETHVLNAVSPAFTSSFSFSKHIVQHYL